MASRVTPDHDEKQGVATDGVVALSGYILADVPALVQADQDPEHRRRLGTPDHFVPSEAHSRAVLARWERERDAGTRFPFAVRDVETGELLGGIELQPRPDREANVSYWTRPGYRNRGVARRALTLLTTVVAGNLGLEVLEISADPDNAASRKVAEGAGFVLSGTRDGRVVYSTSVTARIADRA